MCDLSAIFVPDLPTSILISKCQCITTSSGIHGLHAHHVVLLAGVEGLSRGSDSDGQNALPYRIIGVVHVLQSRNLGEAAGAFRSTHSAGT